MNWWKNVGLRPPDILKRHSRSTLCHDLFPRSIAMSAAVAPVATHWGSLYIASLVDGFVDNS